MAMLKKKKQENVYFLFFYSFKFWELVGLQVAQDIHHEPQREILEAFFSFYQMPVTLDSSTGAVHNWRHL